MGKIGLLHFIQNSKIIPFWALLRECIDKTLLLFSRSLKHRLTKNWAEIRLLTLRGSSNYIIVADTTGCTSNGHRPISFMLTKPWLCSGIRSTRALWRIGPFHSDQLWELYYIFCCQSSGWEGSCNTILATEMKVKSAEKFLGNFFLTL